MNFNLDINNLDLTNLFNNFDQFLKDNFDFDEYFENATSSDIAQEMGIDQDTLVKQIKNNILNQMSDNLLSLHRDTSINDDDKDDRVSAFNRYLYKYLTQVRYYANEINHKILIERANNAWQFGNWQLVIATIKDINN